MGARGLVAIAMAAVLMGACTKRIDDKVRDAWGGSTKAPTANGGADAILEGNGEVQDEGEAPVREGWDRAEEILDIALQEAAVGTDDEVMARLADRWCATEPTPKTLDDEVVRVCLPNPPVQIDGLTFGLELGGGGVIGLVARGLTAEESSRLAKEARRRTERWCTQTWTSHPADPTSPSEDARLYTCAVEGSALLAVGSFFVGEGDQWQVSVTVIDAS